MKRAFTPETHIIKPHIIGSGITEGNDVSVIPVSRSTNVKNCSYRCCEWSDWFKIEISYIAEYCFSLVVLHTFNVNENKFKRINKMKIKHWIRKQYKLKNVFWSSGRRIRNKFVFYVFFCHNKYKMKFISIFLLKAFENGIPKREKYRVQWSTEYFIYIKSVELYDER